MRPCQVTASDAPSSRPASKLPAKASLSELNRSSQNP